MDGKKEESFFEDISHLAVFAKACERNGPDKVQVREALVVDKRVMPLIIGAEQDNNALHAIP